MRSRSDRWARGIGILLGSVLVWTGVLLGDVPRGTGILGTDVFLVSGPTGELSVDPAGPFVTATDLRPSSEASVPGDEVRVANITGTRLRVHVRLVPSSTDLDDLLWVRIDADGRQLFRGPLDGLRRWTPGAITLASTQSATVSARAWLPADSGPGWQGRVEQIQLEFLSVPEGG